MTNSQHLLLHQCPVCGSNQRRLLFPVHQSFVYSCQPCGLRYLDPCMSQKDMSDFYESPEQLFKSHAFYQTYYDYGDLTKPSKTMRDYQVFLSCLDEMSSSQKKTRTFFEVGYGNGLFLAAAQKKGWQVAGIDSSHRNRSVARHRFGLELQQGDFMSCQSSLTNGYDVVVAMDVLEHFYQPMAFLEKIYSYLSAEGFFLIAVPNDLSFLRLLSESLFRMSFGLIRGGIEKTYLMEHTVYYTRQTLSALLQKCGFIIKKQFFSSTDLERYHFTAIEKLAASGILNIGKLIHLENRLIMIGQKPSEKIIVL